MYRVQFLIDCWHSQITGGCFGLMVTWCPMTKYSCSCLLTHKGFMTLMTYIVNQWCSVEYLDVSGPLGYMMTEWRRMNRVLWEYERRIVNEYCCSSLVNMNCSGYSFLLGMGKKAFIRSKAAYHLPATILIRRRQWHPTPVLFPGKSHGRRSLVGCSPWGRSELDTTEQLHFNFSHSCIGEGNGNPLQCSCLESPRDSRAWWAAVYGVAQSWTWLKWLSSILIYSS